MKADPAQLQPGSDRKAQLTEELSQILAKEAKEEARKQEYERALRARDTARERLAVGKQKLAEYTRCAEVHRKEGRKLWMSLGEFMNQQTKPAYDQIPADSALDWLEWGQWQGWRLSYLAEFISELEAEVVAADSVFVTFCADKGWPVPEA